MSQIKTKFIENAAITDAKVSTGIDAAKLADGSVSNAEFQFINSVTSNVQTQINGKQSTTLTNAHILVGNGSNVATDVAVSGDVTIANTGAVTIANDAVSFAKMQNIPTDSLIGRDTAGSGDPETILLNATLSMDGAGNLQRAALTGDVTASAGSNATTIANNAVTTAKIAADAVTGAKIRLANNETLRARNQANSADVGILKLSATDKILLLDNAGLESANSSDRTLTDSAGKAALAWETSSRTLFDEAEVPAMHFTSSNRELVASDNTQSLGFTAPGVLEANADINVNPVTGAASTVNMFNNAGSFKSVVSADPALAANTLFQLPPDNGTAGYFLQTDGAGVTSWAVASGSSATWEKQTFVLSGTDITNQYIDLSNVASTKSIHFMVKGAPSLLEGASYDYSVSYTGGAGGNTRITFLNDLATGGGAALIAGDVVQVHYQF